MKEHILSERVQEWACILLLEILTLCPETRNDLLDFDGFNVVVCAPPPATRSSLYRILARIRVFYLKQNLSYDPTVGNPIADGRYRRDFFGLARGVKRIKSRHFSRRIIDFCQKKTFFPLWTGPPRYQKTRCNLFSQVFCTDTLFRVRG
jgi:hypothetical protein